MPHDYFSQIAFIWTMYFKKKISMSERDAMLKLFRDEEFGSI